MFNDYLDDAIRSVSVRDNNEKRFLPLVIFTPPLYYIPKLQSIVLRGSYKELSRKQGNMT